MYDNQFLLSMQGFYLQITFITKKERTLEYFLNLHIFFIYRSTDLKF